MTNYLKKDDVLKIILQSGFEKKQVPNYNEYYYSNKEFNIYFVNKEMIIEFKEYFKVFDRIPSDIIIGIKNYCDLNYNQRLEITENWNANNFIKNVRKIKGV
jgi:hypothetical protein